MTIDLQAKPIPNIAIVVPCYNEEEMLPKTLSVLRKLLDKLQNSNKIGEESKIYFVDDGSKDKTWQLLSQAANTYSNVCSIKLSKNRGHQNAVYAGLTVTTEDAIVSIDADLQDDPENIETMVDRYIEGYDVVYGVRSERNTDTKFKRYTAEGYYHVMKLLGVDLVFNHADFRITSRRALNALLEYPESNLFLRGLIREVGYPWTTVEYARSEREAGESKYPLKKMLSLAWQGVSAFSAAPLRIITVLGMVSSFISMLFIGWVLFVKIFTFNAIPGWASILVPLLFIGSIQLVCIGVIGEYLAKIYDEVKRRPKFHLDKVIK